MGRTIFGQVFVREGVTKISKWKVPPPGVMLAKFDKDQTLRQRVLERLDRDFEYARKTKQPDRQDIQRARRIIARQGFSGLFRALEPGVALPAASALAPAFSELQGEADQGE
jgi:hypothetical protein